MSTLLEMIRAAGQMLPGLAEAEAKAAQERPANPQAEIFDQLRAKAEQEGKKHFTFMGRAVETKGGETFDQMRARLPQGELEAGGGAMAAAPISQQMREQSIRLAKEGSAAFIKQPWNILDDVSIAATKSKAVPISEVKQLEALVAEAKKTKMVTYNADSVLEREAARKLEQKLRAMEALRSGRTSTVLRGTTAASGILRRGNKLDEGGQY